jgi:protein-L-isoaspartate(D-aspartate) O-methyltransferase
VARKRKERQSLRPVRRVEPRYTGAFSGEQPRGARLALAKALPLEMRRGLTDFNRMTDFALSRRTMVDTQVRTSDVTDLRLIAAMLDIPRERFVPPDKADLAYLDLDLPVASGVASRSARRLLKPMVFAKLVQAAAIRADDHVLDVGCASGYSSAVLARLAGAVVSLEQDAALAQQAGENLAATGARNVTLVTGPLTEGWPAKAPYDVIMVEGATENPPNALSRQLKEGGRLVAVVGRPPASKAMLYVALQSDVSGRPIFDAAAPLLPGFLEPQAFVF